MTSVSFSHIHLYADHLDDLSSYKKLEAQLNDFSEKTHGTELTLFQKRDLWSGSLADPESESKDDNSFFATSQRDVVRQLLSGFGFRITGARYHGMVDHVTNSTITTNTRSVLITSKDVNGIQIVVTAPDEHGQERGSDPVHHFDAARVHTFFKAHHGRQGIAVLSFLVDSVEMIHERYQRKHPLLVSHCQGYPTGQGSSSVIRILEVFAFYHGHDEDDDSAQRQADQGTILRFLQLPKEGQNKMPPGLVPQAATFDHSSYPAYSDHWVSNVISRTEFLYTLHDTLDFHPKVDFNAGVVAAGEAQIESTVTGNDSTLSTMDKEIALRGMSQVYLPINNALSEVGHVHLFLKEIGQGVQHVASRVENLVGFVQRANEQVKILNEGFTFLNIPRSYYGVLAMADLEKVVSTSCARRVWKMLDSKNLLAHDGALDLDTTRNDLEAILASDSNLCESEQDKANLDSVIQVILQSRYKNLYNLLREHLSEETYLGIVRNQILVDIQGEDLLYQIFTCKILHREQQDEAPFFEFIERVCSECNDDKGCPQKIRPGCGGFGIRNFLTLFLSIEVSKAMQAVAKANEEGDKAKQEYEQTRVEYFTAQLNESNPILTEISDAMTDEGLLQQQILSAHGPEETDSLRARLQIAMDRKRAGNAKLMETSGKYNDMMKSLREEYRM